MALIYSKGISITAKNTTALEIDLFFQKPDALSIDMLRLHKIIGLHGEETPELPKLHANQPFYMTCYLNLPEYLIRQCTEGRIMGLVGPRH
jgi:hypothetical protein